MMITGVHVMLELATRAGQVGLTTWREADEILDSFEMGTSERARAITEHGAEDVHTSMFAPGATEATSAGTVTRWPGNGINGLFIRHMRSLSIGQAFESSSSGRLSSAKHVDGQRRSNLNDFEVQFGTSTG
jgi:hypothetical protein